MPAIYLVPASSRFTRALAGASGKYSARVSDMQDVVLLVHGLMSLRDRVRFPEIAAALAAKGIGSLRFDLRGNGDSGGEFRYAGSFDEVRSSVERSWHCSVAVAGPQSTPNLVCRAVSLSACAR